MSALKISAYFFLVCFLFFFSTRRVSSVNYVHHSCPNTTMYSPNSTYQSNLNQLLHILYSNATQEKAYYHYTVGNSHLDELINGLFLCRGDVNTNVCEQCVGDAITEILQRCPYEKAATIVYDECMLGYSDQPIFSRLDTSFMEVLRSPKNISGSPHNFTPVLSSMFKELLADNKFAGNKFATATKDVNWTASEKLYIMAQCLPDLSGEDCNICLKNATSVLPSCCNYSQGGRVISLSCNIRYERYRFYNTGPAPEFALSPVPAPAPALALAPVNYVDHSCPDTSTYSPNSTYQSNLNQLLHTLSSNATQEKAYYPNIVGNSSPDEVNGLFLCRGDVNADVCEQCVGDAITEILQRCPYEKAATIVYDECMLGYSDQSIFSRLDMSFMVVLRSPKYIGGSPYNFMRVLSSIFKKLLADNKFTGNKYSTATARYVNWTASEKLYIMAQCLPDLSGEDCNICLKSATSLLPSCCNYSQGGRVISLSCNIRYEMYRFYNTKTGPATELAFAPVPAPALAPVPKNKQGNGKLNRGISGRVIIAIVVPSTVSLVVLLVGLRILTGRMMKKKQYGTIKERNDENEISTVESLQYDLKTIELATTSFSADNKIGEGGFGDVYKGTLPDGREIAVKRLSRSSAQGAKEFKNEILLVAKLQHRNLARLLGFCLEGEEKILIYEFVPNKSLDYFLFDAEKQRPLDWSRRYKIIGGIARGMLYLHEDSRLKIVHRDLKASNILLDGEMNPKISDFGMARIFDADQSQENTIRIAGTYGYMAPEYALHGQFSVKSDIFSFGVLILEIISGKKSNGFYRSHGTRDLISYAWKLWRNGAPLEMMDPTLQQSYVLDEVIRCIQIGLLCAEEDVNKRPMMSSILPMLESYSDSLPIPRKPAFFIPSGSDSMTEELQDQSQSINEASISELSLR